MHRLARTVRVLAVALGAAGAGAALSACGGGISPSGIAACRDVQRSIATYDASLRIRDVAERSARQQLAERQLAAGLSSASQAASGNGQWQALMTTIGEVVSPGVPEAELIPALQAQCAQDTGASGAT